MDGNGDGWLGGGGNPWQFDKPHLVMTLGDCFHPLLSVCAPTCRRVLSSLSILPSLPCFPLSTSPAPPPTPPLPPPSLSDERSSSERAVEGSVAAASI